MSSRLNDVTPALLVELRAICGGLVNPPDSAAALGNLEGCLEGALAISQAPLRRYRSRDSPRFTPRGQARRHLARIPHHLVTRSQVPAGRPCGGSLRTIEMVIGLEVPVACERCPPPNRAECMRSREGVVVFWLYPRSSPSQLFKRVAISLLLGRPTSLC